MLVRGSLDQAVHPADDEFHDRRAKFHLPVSPYSLPASISPPLTPAYERTDDDLFPATASSSTQSPRDLVSSPDFWPEDEALSSIEKIYLFSRSKLVVHRSVKRYIRIPLRSSYLAGRI